MLQVITQLLSLKIWFTKALQAFDNCCMNWFSFPTQRCSLVNISVRGGEWPDPERPCPSQSSLGTRFGGHCQPFCRLCSLPNSAWKVLSVLSLAALQPSSGWWGGGRGPTPLSRAPTPGAGDKSGSISPLRTWPTQLFPSAPPWLAPFSVSSKHSFHTTQPLPPTLCCPRILSPIRGSTPRPWFFPPFPWGWTFLRPSPSPHTPCYSQSKPVFVRRLAPCTGKLAEENVLFTLMPVSQTRGAKVHKFT